MNAYSILTLITATIFTACQKDNPKPYVMDLPEKITFTVLDSKGNSLLISPDQKIPIFLFKDGHRQEITDYRLDAFPSTFPLTGYTYSSRDIPLFSGDNNIREFYMNLNGDVDTLYVEVKKSSIANSAGGLYTYQKVQFNGQEVPAQYQPGIYLYVFRKR